MLLQVGQYVFKLAETRQEFEQVHRLNYQTFVGEIPQHADTGTGVLVDKFHTKNIYFIVLREGRVEIMGGTYNEPNTNLTYAESTIRNLVHGIGFQRDVLGGDPRTAWQLDVFGHDPQ